jgi:predicted nucleic acid-binding protein
VATAEPGTAPSPECAKATIWASRRPIPATNSVNDRFFVDTNILVYAYDDSAGAKRAIALSLLKEVLQSGAAIIGTQVLQELVICLRRKVARPLQNQEIRKIVSELLNQWEVFVDDSKSVLHLLEIQDRYKTSFWDALILYAAQESAAQTLYTEV